jgi:hypothetical protein
VSVWPCLCFASASNEALGTDKLLRWRDASFNCFLNLCLGGASHLPSTRDENIFIRKTRALCMMDAGCWKPKRFVFTTGYMQISCRPNERQVWQSVVFLKTSHLNASAKILSRTSTDYFIITYGTTAHTWALSSSVLRFLNHTQTHSRTPLDQWSARRRDLYLHRTTQHINTRDKHPCPQRDSNPRTQRPRGRRSKPRGHRDRRTSTDSPDTSYRQLVPRRKLLSFGILRRVVWDKLTDVSEMLSASIIRATSMKLGTEDVSNSETWVNF